MAYLKKDQKGYYRLFEKVKGQRRYLKYIGKDPSSFQGDIERGKELLTKLKVYPDLALKGGQSALAEYKRRKFKAPDLPLKKYKTIVIDPPWPMEKILREVAPEQFGFDYPVMTLKEIKAWPIQSFMEDSCHIYLWTTQKFLPSAFRILEIWGIEYIFTMVWHKNGGFQPFGLPQYNAEFVLFGRVGGLDFLDIKAFFTCFDGERRAHSRKPIEFYDLVRRVSPEPRIDIFSREPHEGFEQYGSS